MTQMSIGSKVTILDFEWLLITRELMLPLFNFKRPPTFSKLLFMSLRVIEGLSKLIDDDSFS